MSPNPNAEDDRPPNYTPSPTSGRDSVHGDKTKCSHIANYSKRPSSPTSLIISFAWILLAYYRIYAEDGAIPSKTPVLPGDPFVGRINARSVPPPHTAESIKLRIAKAEDINLNDPTTLSLFLTIYNQSPLDDAEKVNILDRTGAGSTPQAPLALVAKILNSERSALESGRRGRLMNAEPLPDFQYRSSIQYSSTFLFVLTSRLLGKVYYQVFANNSDVPSKVAFDQELPSLGCIRCDSIAPPHTPASIKRRISRVEETPELVNSNLFATIRDDSPLKEAHILILGTDIGLGLSPDEPMAIVQMPISQVESTSIPDGRNIIKNRAADILWTGWNIAKSKIHSATATPASKGV